MSVGSSLKLLTHDLTPSLFSQPPSHSREHCDGGCCMWEDVIAGQHHLLGLVGLRQPLLNRTTSCVTRRKHDLDSGATAYH